MGKWILITLGSLLLALAAGLAFAILNLNSYLDDNRDWLAAQVEASLGRSVSFERIGVSFMGGLGVEITQLVIGDDPAFSGEAFIRADEVMVLVRPWPALQGRYEVARIALNAPDISIWRTAAGLSTDSLGGAGATASAATPPQPGTPSDSSPAATSSQPPAVLIALVDIRDGRLRYVDSSSGEGVETLIEQLDLEASDVNLNDPIRFELSAALFSASEQNTYAKGSIGPLDGENASLSPLDVELSLRDLSVPALLATPAFANALPPELSVDGVIGLEASVSGSLAELAVRWAFDATSAALHYEGQLDKPTGTALEVNFAGTLVGDSFEIVSSTFRLDRASVDGQGTVKLAEPVRYDLKLRSEALPLAGLDQRLLALKGLGLAGSAQLDVRVSGSSTDTGLPDLNGIVRLESLSARPESTPPVTGLSTTVSLAEGGASMPASSFELAGAAVQLAASIADLEQPVVVFDFSSREINGAALGLGADSDVEALRDLKVVGEASSDERGPKLRADLQSGSGRVSGLDYQNGSVSLRYSESLATLEKLRLEAYQGVITGSGKYDMTREDDPSFELQTRVRGLRIEALAESQFGAQQGDVLEGVLDTEIELAGHGKDSDAIKRALTGNGRFELREGLLRDINIAERALSSITGVPGLSHVLSPRVRQKYPGVFSSGDTVFEMFEGRFGIRRGQLQLENASMKARDYGVKAAGSIGLDSSVDVLATLTTSPDLTRSLIGSSQTTRYILGSAGRISVPVRLGGTLNDMSALPDVSALATNALQNAATGALSDLLRDKLGGPPAPRQPAPDPRDGEAREPTSRPVDTPAPVDPLEDLLRRGIERGLEDLL